jgi:hypothetical protein
MLMMTCQGRDKLEPGYLAVAAVSPVLVPTTYGLPEERGEGDQPFVRWDRWAKAATGRPVMPLGWWDVDALSPLEHTARYV